MIPPKILTQRYPLQLFGHDGVVDYDGYDAQDVHDVHAAHTAHTAHPAHPAHNSYHAGAAGSLHFVGYPGPNALTCESSACLIEDDYINTQATSFDLAELEDCAIAVDATYYLQRLLTTPPSKEPLLTALGGLTGLQTHIEHDLDQWEEHKMVPFFIFDGQPLTGQDEVFIARGREAIEKSNQAWELYANGQAQEAVDSFGEQNGAFHTQDIYPMLQAILKQRNLHFLVPPYNAAAQIAYFDMIDSDQCGGIMGPQELLLYPIKDSIIRSMDWDGRTVTAVSKKQIIKSLAVGENTFYDGFLMAGTSFLPTFPPLLDTSILQLPRRPTIVDAINMLRTADKSVSAACQSFGDILKLRDPKWLDKYLKAKMTVNHFIYIGEDGEVKVNNFDKLTGDNHEYLGLQLPSELFHYLNIGLIGSRILGWITHSKITVFPTMDGHVSDEYRRLVTTQLVPVKEMTLGLLIPRLSRGIAHRDVEMKVWYDDKFSYTVNHRNLQPSPSLRAASWLVTDGMLREHFPGGEPGSIAFEVLALKKADFVKKGATKERIQNGALDSSNAIVSVAIWRFLHLRGYVTDTHELTVWGQALSKAIETLQPTAKTNPDFPCLFEALLVAFELVRYGLLHTKHTLEESHGLPLNGTEDDKGSLLLLSRAACLLKLRHQPTGYTGPLNKTLLVFHSLASAVRTADRDLTEAVVASMFMYAQAKRERDDAWEISQRLPFLKDPDIAFGIAIKTLLDEVVVGEPDEERRARIESFPPTYLPHAMYFNEDLEIFYSFFGALVSGLKILPEKELSAASKVPWETAVKYMQLRR